MSSADIGEGGGEGSAYSRPPGFWGRDAAQNEDAEVLETSATKVSLKQLQDGIWSIPTLLSAHAHVPTCWGPRLSKPNTLFLTCTPEPLETRSRGTV